MSSKRERGSSLVSSSDQKRPRVGPLPVLLCPPHDTEFKEFVCVCDLEEVKKIINESTKTKIEIYFQLAILLTPATYEGRKVILPRCIRDLVQSHFPISKGTAFRASDGPRAVLVTPLRRTASLPELKGEFTC